jgi:hypothetical protein
LRGDGRRADCNVQDLFQHFLWYWRELQSLWRRVPRLRRSPMGTSVLSQRLHLGLGLGLGLGLVLGLALLGEAGALVMVTLSVVSTR